MLVRFHFWNREKNAVVTLTIDDSFDLWYTRFRWESYFERVLKIRLQCATVIDAEI